MVTIRLEVFEKRKSKNIGFYNIKLLSGDVYSHQIYRNRYTQTLTSAPKRPVQTNKNSYNDKRKILRMSKQYNLFD